MPRSAVTFVVMAGGRGERLWPLVRLGSPKVCLSADGRRSLLRATVDRLRRVWPRARWLIVTTQEQAGAVRQALPSSSHGAILVEPEGRNTAACITLAAVTVARQHPDQVMAVVPADHWIGDVTAYQDTLRTAIRAAISCQSLVTIGIPPTAPHPGLGYLCAGRPIKGFRHARVFGLVRFVEKPSREMAQQLIRRARAYWNSGMFIGTAETFLECVTEWLPEHARRLVPLANRVGTNAFAARVSRAYRALPAVSFDHGVMDHLRRGVVVEGRFPWADLGSWDTWARLGQGAARTLSVESHNVTVVSQGDHLVATIGVRDLLIVHTPSATLVCRLDRAQAVREVVKRLAANRRLASFR